MLIQSRYAIEGLESMTDTALLKCVSSVFYGVRDKVAGIDGLEPVTDTSLLESESSSFSVRIIEYSKGGGPCRT